MRAHEPNEMDVLPSGASERRSMQETSEAIFRPGGGERWRDPFPMYAALREHDPVHRVPDNGKGEDYYVLSRFDDVFAAAVDAKTFSSASGLTFEYGDMEALGLDSPASQPSLIDF